MKAREITFAVVLRPGDGAAPPDRDPSREAERERRQAPGQRRAGDPPEWRASSWGAPTRARESRRTPAVESARAAPARSASAEAPAPRRIPAPVGIPASAPLP